MLAIGPGDKYNNKTTIAVYINDSVKPILIDVETFLIDVASLLDANSLKDGFLISNSNDHNIRAAFTNITPPHKIHISTKSVSL